MKPFKLASVLRFREHRESAMQEQHDALMRRYREMLEALEALERERERTDGTLARLQGMGRLDLLALDNAHRYLDRLAASIEEQAQRVAEAERHVEEARTALVRATQERQALEKLRDRDAAVQKQEGERREAAENDSLTAARLGWRRQTERVGG